MDKKPDVSKAAIARRMEAENLRLKKIVEKFMAPILIDIVTRPESLYDYLEQNADAETSQFLIDASVNGAGQMVININPLIADSNQLKGAPEGATFMLEDHEDHVSMLNERYSKILNRVLDSERVWYNSTTDTIHRGLLDVDEVLNPDEWSRVAMIEIEREPLKERITRGNPVKLIL